MAKLQLSIAIGNYDRVRPIVDGAVRIDGVDPIFQLLEPEEIFFRAFRQAEFDICELSFSSFVVKTARGECPYVGVPVFPSRMFRHNAIVIRKDRGIRRPEDLRGKRIGTPEYQLTAHVWARALLEDEYGVRPSDVTWVRGGLEEAGRIEKVGLSVPPDVRIVDAPAGVTLSALLATGEIDAIIAPRAPSCLRTHPAEIGLLFPDTVEAATAYFQRTGLFPIMHVLGVRRELAEAHRWLPNALLKAFEAAKAIAIGQLGMLAASPITLPFAEERLEATRRLMGDDFWPYGVAANRHVLNYFLDHHHRQGLSAERVKLEALFDPSTFEQFRI